MKDTGLSSAIAAHPGAHLGPLRQQTAANVVVQLDAEEQITLLKKNWPTVTALNFAESAEFHLRLRQHVHSGIFLVYGSTSKSTQELRSSGRFCRDMDEVQRAIQQIQLDLGIGEGVVKL